MSNVVDEHIERLITRHLDGELTPAETEEFNAIMMKEPAARALLHEYADIDHRAQAALRRVLIKPAAAVASPAPRRGLWLAAAGAVLAAAAALGLFVFPYQATPPRRPIPMIVDQRPAAPSPNSRDVRPQYVADRGLSGPEAWRQIVPQRDSLGIRRNCVGVYDPKTRRYYLIEVDRRDSRQTPVLFGY
ncbi:MAG: hypothetical protein V3T70_08150 [Phycisphaerae bacterium]